MNDYEAKQAERRKRYLARAERAEAEAREWFEKADMREEQSGIPFGQPILVGHHSERKMRRAYERADAAMRKGIEAQKKAEYYRRKAEGVGLRGISSDDPEAVEKLRAKLSKLIEMQDLMKRINAVVRRWRSGRIDENKCRAALLDFVKPALAEEAMQPDQLGRYGCPAYMLDNNRAEIRRTEKRIQALEARRSAKAVDREVAPGVRLVENPEINRIQLIFDGKPDEVTRRVLKSRGFRWAPSQGAWQRHLNAKGRYAAEAAIKEITQ